MIYEEYFDEVIILIIEKYDVVDEVVIKMVMCVQVEDFFIGYDDDLLICMLDCVYFDVKVIFKKYK